MVWRGSRGGMAWGQRRGAVQGGGAGRLSAKQGWPWGEAEGSPAAPSFLAPLAPPCSLLLPRAPLAAPPAHSLVIEGECVHDVGKPLVAQVLGRQVGSLQAGGHREF